MTECGELLNIVLASLIKGVGYRGISYSIQPSWQVLIGNTNVYIRPLMQAGSDRVFPLAILLLIHQAPAPMHSQC